MKCVALLTVFFFASIAAANILEHVDVDRQWMLFKAKHNKYYTREEDAYRKQLFTETLIKVAKHNIESDLGVHTWRKGINKFADLTREEIDVMYKGYKMGGRRGIYVFENSSSVLPKSVDWREKGLVLPVKDQGQCGSCWAFSTVASLEGQRAKKTGNLVSLSEQQLVDCSADYGNQGCDGGLMDNAFKYIIANKGIDTEKSYPYMGEVHVCKFDPVYVGATMTSFVDIESGSEAALQEATAKIGPIAVAIDASGDDFQAYAGGVYSSSSCSTTSLDHGVAVVGYGTEDGNDYWIVRNSWGADWGEHGYIRMSRNKHNQCGIATEASYPIV